jgi:hypothetical protein
MFMFTEINIRFGEAIGQPITCFGEGIGRVSQARQARHKHPRSPKRGFSPVVGS